MNRTLRTNTRICYVCASTPNKKHTCSTHQNVSSMALNQEQLTAIITAAMQGLQLHQNTASPPKFVPNSDDVNDWLVAFNTTMASADDSTKIAKMPTVLTDRALTWFCCQKQTTAGASRSWSDWEIELKKEFGRNEMSILLELDNLKQGTLKPEAYYHRVLALCSKVNPNMSELEKVQKLQRGLNPELRNKMTLMFPTSSSDFLAKLQHLSTSNVAEVQEKSDQQKIIDSLITLLGQKSEKPTQTQSTGPTIQPSYYQEQGSLAAEIRELKEQVQRLSRPTERSNGRRTCFNCGRSNHLVKDCRAPGGPKNRSSNRNGNRNNRSDRRQDSPNGRSTSSDRNSSPGNRNRRD